MGREFIFTHKYTSRTLRIVAHTYEYPNSWGHKAEATLKSEYRCFTRYHSTGMKYIKYYNRTWESFRYQSICDKCIKALEDDLKLEIINNWKYWHEYKVMTKSRKEVFEAYMETVIQKYGTDREEELTNEEIDYCFLRKVRSEIAYESKTGGEF